MKTIGVIGGMSWESTASYYSALNQSVAQSHCDAAVKWALQD
ncbi:MULTISPECIES: hypothetical protein [Marinomonas]|nr:hypothetical protein [Marinomonas sp. KMM3893]